MPRLRLALQAPRNTLIVVGALHLCGTGSIWELLEQEGYSLIEEATGAHTGLETRSLRVL